MSKVLFCSSNGVGLGHVTRLLALADCMPDEVECLFATLSPAVNVIVEHGYYCEHLQSSAYMESWTDKWMGTLYLEFCATLDLHAPRVVVFDGNYLYPGIVRAVNERPGVVLVWIRRAMWKPNQGTTYLQDQKYCDLVIEPGELAADYDQGATRDAMSRFPPPLGYAKVDPIMYHREFDPISRTELEKYTGSTPHDIVCLVQIGAGNQEGNAFLLDEILAVLREAGNVKPLVVEWLISEQRCSYRDDVNVAKVFPAAALYSGADFSISTCGYNTFHEAIHYGLPTIFVPTERTNLDDQKARSQYANDHDLSLMVEQRKLADLPERVRCMTNRDNRAAISERCRSVGMQNGAHDAARFIRRVAGI